MTRKCLSRKRIRARRERKYYGWVNKYEPEEIAFFFFSIMVMAGHGNGMTT
jgi:hypothetical protein